MNIIIIVTTLSCITTININVELYLQLPLLQDRFLPSFETAQVNFTLIMCALDRQLCLCMWRTICGVVQTGVFYSFCTRVLALEP